MQSVWFRGKKVNDLPAIWSVLSDMFDWMQCNSGDFIIRRLLCTFFGVLITFDGLFSVVFGSIIGIFYIDALSDGKTSDGYGCERFHFRLTFNQCKQKRATTAALKFAILCLAIDAALVAINDGQLAIQISWPNLTGSVRNSMKQFTWEVTAGILITPHFLSVSVTNLPFWWKTFTNLIISDLCLPHTFFLRFFFFPQILKFFFGRICLNVRPKIACHKIEFHHLEFSADKRQVPREKWIEMKISFRISLRWIQLMNQLSRSWCLHFGHHRYCLAPFTKMSSPFLACKFCNCISRTFYWKKVFDPIFYVRRAICFYVHRNQHTRLRDQCVSFQRMLQLLFFPH